VDCLPHGAAHVQAREFFHLQVRIRIGLVWFWLGGVDWAPSWESTYQASSPTSILGQGLGCFGLAWFTCFGMVLGRVDCLPLGAVDSQAREFLLL
jgi:hypothetical protein